MDLIVTERGRTHAAHLNDGEWTDYGSSEMTLAELTAWLSRPRAEDRMLDIDGSGAIRIDFVSGAGVTKSQLQIDCNAEDRNALVALLREICVKESS